MDSALLAACLVVGLLLAFRTWWGRRRLRQLAASIPGAPTLPVLGNALQVAGGSAHIFSYLCRLREQHPAQPLRLWLGPLLYVFITTADDIEKLFLSERLQYRDNYMTDKAKSLMRNVLATPKNGDAKVIDPEVAQAYTELFNRQAAVLVKRLAKFATGDEFDIAELVKLDSLDDTLNSKNASRAQLQILGLYERFIRPWLMIDTLHYLTPDGREKNNFENTLHDASDTVIYNIQSGRCLQEPGKTHDTFLDLLADFSASDHRGRSGVTGLGSDTMCLTLMLLALHPQVEQDIHSELKEVFSDAWERAVTVHDLEKLQRLHCAIKETMRLFPPVFHKFREVPAEVQLTSCSLPAGCVVSTMAYFVHRDARYFPDPERFVPARFSPDKCRSRPAFSYIPFGAGQRSLLSQQLAEMQGVISLATILRRFRVLPAVSYDQLQQLDVSEVARPACGYKLKMVPR